MSVFRVHKTANYTVMSNQHLRDTNLTLKAKGLMSIMLSLPDDWDYSASGLATLSLGGEDVVKSALKELEEHHYLKRTAIREKGVIKDWQYDIYENPETLENIESQPQGEKPLVAKPLVENQPQINTYILNKEEINNNSTNVELEQPTVTRKSLITVDKSIKTETSHNRKKNLYEKCLDKIDALIDCKDIEVKERLTEYLKVRLERKDIQFGSSGFEGMIKKLLRLSDNSTERLAIIQQSIDRNYPTFYPLKQSNYKGQDKNVFSEYGKVKIGSNENEVITNVQF